MLLCGAFSDQIDVVVFDRQYSPFIFRFQARTIIPAESVYAVFEAKQVINATQVDYAQKKVATVRRLHRTSLPIPHAGGTYAPKPLPAILGGLLTFESDWSPPLGQPLTDALTATDPVGRLDLELENHSERGWAANSWSGRRMHDRLSGGMGRISTGSVAGRDRGSAEL